MDLAPDERAAWSPKNSLAKELLFPVEVGTDWSPIVNQGATYARCLFIASPSQQFAVVLGSRHSRAELRFLLFHHRGLAESHPLSVNDESGQEEMLRIFAFHP